MFVKETKVRKDILIHSSVAAIFLVALLHAFHRKRMNPLNDPDIAKNVTTNFDDSRAGGEPLVPNHVHFILLNGANNISFTHFLCILSVLKNQCPDSIFFHTNTGNLNGVYWDRLTRIPQFRRVARINRVQIPDAILDQPLTENIRVFYGIGILKILLLRKYGGIYMDTNVYVTRDLNEFRNAELTLDGGRGMSVGSKIFLAHENSRFLKVWAKLYRRLYESSSWYYFSQNPIDAILKQHSDLAGCLPETGELQFYDRNSSRFKESGSFWRSYYVFQLPRDLQYYVPMEPQFLFDFRVSEENVAKYHIPLSEMMEEVSMYAKNNTDIS